MIVQGKGWGWSVFYVSILWMFVVFGVVIYFGIGSSDPQNDDRLFYQICAVWLTLSAATVFALDRWREGKARNAASEAVGPFIETKRDDEFLYMRMWAWPYVLLAFAAWALGASFFV
jgi:hypothetical protein